MISCTALLLYALNANTATLPEWVAVARDTPVETLTLRAGQMVRVLGSEGDRVRVEANDHEHWIARDRLLSPADFQPLQTWAGSARVYVFAESYDATQTYFIRRDGSFRALLDINFDPGPSHWQGQLHRAGDVVWARREGSEEFGNWELFQARLGDELCWLNLHEQPCACMGAGERALSCDAAPKAVTEVQLRPGPGEPAPPRCAPMIVRGFSSDPSRVVSGPGPEARELDALAAGHRVWACDSDVTAQSLSVIYAPSGSTADCSRLAEAPLAGTDSSAGCRSGWISAEHLRDLIGGYAGDD